MLVPLQCRRRVLQLEGAGLLVPLQAAAAGCCFRVLLLEWCVRCGAGLPVQNASNLQGAAVRVLCVCVFVFHLYRCKTSIMCRGQRDLQMWPLPTKLHTG